MPIKINGSTSGSTTITAPATGTDETIELSTALAAKAPLASPALTGTPTVGGVAITALSGLQLITAVAVAGSSTVTVDSCFTSAYENYVIVLRLTSTADDTLKIRLRASGADNTTTNYQFGRYYVGAGVSQAAGSQNNVTSDLWNCTYLGTNQQGESTITLAGPQAAINTTGHSVNGGQFLDIYAYKFAAATQFDGFKVFTGSAGTLTGNVRVYGFRNS